MDREELEKRLHNISKTAFVVFFSFFRKCYTEKKRTKCCAKELSEKTGEAESGARTRCSAAKTIFRKKAEREALKFIIDDDLSPEISDSVKSQAKKLLDDLSAGKN